MPLAVRHAVSNCEKEMAQKLNEDGGALMKAGFFLPAGLANLQNNYIPRMQLRQQWSGTKGFEESSRLQGGRG